MMNINELIAELMIVRDGINTVEVKGVKNLSIVLGLYERCDSLIERLKNVIDELQNVSNNEKEGETDVGVNTDPS